MVRLMIIIEVLLGFKSKQGNVNTTYTLADIPDNEKVCVEIPIGFEKFYKNASKKCLNIKICSMVSVRFHVTSGNN